jgi:hypothetical protein
MSGDPSPFADPAISCALVAGVLCLALVALAVLLIGTSR